MAPCAGRVNPADDGTKGVQGDRLTASHRWIAGPDFLRMGEEDWPKNCVIPPETKDLEEIHAMVNVITSIRINSAFRNLSPWRAWCGPSWICTSP